MPKFYSDFIQIFSNLTFINTNFLQILTKFYIFFLASTVPESSDDEPILEKPKPKLPTPRSHTPRSMTPKSMTPKSMTPKSMTPKSMTPKSMTPKMTPESPRKSRMGPKKSALAQVSASQDEEDSSLNDSDLVPTNKGNLFYNPHNPMYYFCYRINIQYFEFVVVIKKPKKI